MIDKLKRLKVMKFLSIYYQNEEVSAGTKQSISKGLMSDDNFTLHQEIINLSPVTAAGHSIKKQIVEIIKEENDYDKQRI